MRYYNRARDSGAVILDHYTGVGEVLAVHALDSVFANFISKFASSAAACFPSMTPRTTISSSLAHLRKI